MQTNAHGKSSATDSKALTFDIRRTIMLSAYMKYWGSPEYRQTITRESERVELYSFPGPESSKITRFSTVGLSSDQAEGSRKKNHTDVELLMVLPKDVASEQERQISNYLFDIVAYVLNQFEENPMVGTTIPETPLAPLGWPKAILFDEPRGEPEELGFFHVGSQHVDLLWLVPIYGSEYQLIKKNGLERFDRLVDESNISLVDIGRPSLVSL